MPGDGEYADVSAEKEQSSGVHVQGLSVKAVKRFTSNELQQLNEPHNAHVAIRGKVKRTGLHWLADVCCVF